MGIEEATVRPEGGTFDSTFFWDQAMFGRFRWPTAIVFLTGIAWAMQPVALYYALDPDVREQIPNAVATDWMLHFLQPIFLWLAFGMGLLLVAYYGYGARIRAGRLFKLTGWGMAPFALIGAVRAAGQYQAFQGADLPVGVILGRFHSEWNGYTAMIAEYADDPIIIAANVGSLLILLLSAFIWMYAVKYATDIGELRHVALVVAIPTGCYALYVLVTNLVL